MQRPEIEQTLARLGVDDTVAADDTLGRDALSLDVMLAAPRAAADAVRVPRLESLPELVVLGEPLGSGGAQLADLEVLGTLGEGGMGLVRLARQVSMQREVAVKTLRPGAGQGAAHALLREGVLAGRLDHPNVVPVHALGRDAQAAPLIVMKRIEGVAWRELVRDPDHGAWGSDAGDVGAQRVRHLEILVQVCRAIEFAHSRGIVHRDLKPDNVMIGAFGEVYVVDWGVAAHLDELEGASGAGAVVGTPAYMAPEMISGVPGGVGTHSDVYLLGATLFETLTGRAPHEGHEGLVATLYAALQHDHLVVDAGEVGGELAAIVARATAREPAARYASVRELREALGDYLHHRGSIELTERALADLEALRARFAAGIADESQRRDLFERFTAAQLALHGALEIWPENARARAALQDALELMIDHAVREGNVELADAMLAQLPEPSPQRAEAIAALRARLAGERQASQELRTLRREHDLGVARRPRAWFLGIFTGLALVISAWILFGSGEASGNVSPSVLIGAMVGMLSVYLVAVVALRRRLLTTAINRRLIGSLGIGFVAMLAHRTFAVLDGLPSNVVLRDDLVLEVTVLAGMSLGITRRLWPTCGAFALAAVACGVWPEHTGEIFSLIHAIAPLMAIHAISASPSGD